MKIDLSKEQYLTLIKLLQLGSWPLGLTDNHHRLLFQAEELEQQILKFREDFHAKELINYDPLEDHFYLSDELKDTVEGIIDEYEEEVFWDQLTHKLATIDLKREVHPHSSIEEKLNRLFQIKAEYEKYFIENGLEKLDLLKSLG